MQVGFQPLDELLIGPNQLERRGGSRVLLTLRRLRAPRTSADRPDGEGRGNSAGLEIHGMIRGGMLQPIAATGLQGRIPTARRPKHEQPPDDSRTCEPWMRGMQWEQ